jgi:hypothetical protein
MRGVVWRRTTGQRAELCVPKVRRRCGDLRASGLGAAARADACNVHVPDAHVTVGEAVVGEQSVVHLGGVEGRLAKRWRASRRLCIGVLPKDRAARRSRASRRLCIPVLPKDRLAKRPARRRSVGRGEATDLLRLASRMFSKPARGDLSGTRAARDASHDVRLLIVVLGLGDPLLWQRTGLLDERCQRRRSARSRLPGNGPSLRRPGNQQEPGTEHRRHSSRRCYPPDESPLDGPVHSATDFDRPNL